MTISSSMNAGVMGLSANAGKLGVISDNIANASTYGYKRSIADFSSMVIGGADTGYTAGGVRMASQRLIDERGSLIGTENSTDIAVRGRGMFPVTSEAAVKSGGDLPFLLQTTGSFRTDAEGYLRSQTGQVLMGWPALPDGSIPAFPRTSPQGLEPVQINMNEIAAEPTTRMTLGVNLPATATGPGGTGTPETLSLEYFDNLGTSETLDFTFTPSGATANEWTMQIADTGSGGAVIGDYTLTFNNTPSAGGTLASVTPNSGGPYDPAEGTVAVTTASGPLSVEIGTLGTPGGMTQLSDRFAPSAISKNGSPAGSVVDVDIDPNGRVKALYDIGLTRTLYQIPLADTANPNGLEALDDQTYRVSGESGAFFLWDAGDGPTGEVVNFAREESTTDVANELTEMIQTQRAYSSNAKVIQTVDEMLQETTNIKR